MGRVAVVGLERHIDERVVGDIDADRHVRVDAAVGADAWRAPSPTSYALGHDAGKHAGHKAAPKAIVERDHALVCLRAGCNVGGKVEQRLLLGSTRGSGPSATTRASRGVP